MKRSIGFGKSPGFSLIEVLAAFTVISLTMIVAYKLVADSGQRYANVNQRAEDLNTLRNALAMLEAGQSPSDLPAGVVVDMQPLQTTSRAGTGRVPYLVRVKLSHPSASQSTLETIIFLPRSR